MGFVHLHNHTQYSLLDGACRTDKLVDLARKYSMPAVAMTDHGNLFGTIDFFKNAKKKGIKPILGIEAYLMDKEYDDQDSKTANRYHLILLVQNNVGYKNLIKLSSESYINGFYYKPRISKSVLKKYSEGLICLSACVQGEIPSLLLSNQNDEALDALRFYKETFPGRFYIELMDHGFESEEIVMPQLIELARKTSTPMVVTNDCHYLNKEDSEAHDILLCIQTGKLLSDTSRMRYDSSELYFKTEDEMRDIFPELSEAYDNTVKISEQIDFDLNYSNFLFPQIEIPDNYSSLKDYLKDLCYRAVPEKYPKLNDQISKRIDYELSVIDKMGYEGYFLVVKDFIDAAHRLEVPVGPGRGSAAGSIVSYLLGITRVDPLKFNLFFERFLNSDRIGMPDIDIDFCAEGRNKIIDYVIDKYGRNSVAQIITFGTLGAKSVIKDVARVLGVSPVESNKMTKLIPGGLKVTLKDAKESSKEFLDFMNSNDIYSTVLKYSEVIEGLIRQTGIHAAGVVIGPGSLNEHIPLCTATQKDGQTSILVQYEGKWLDDLKLLKMDFLGLKTLTLIKRTVALIKQSKDIDVEIEKISMDDSATFKIFSEGNTDGIFQFESQGMKKYLCDLQPNNFDDLVAMVALYRPGPMQFIDTYIRRKHGKERVIYDHPLLEQTLKETYGVTVYQEQVMQISRDLGGFSGTEADTLRKAMGKKISEVMERLKNKFSEGAKNRNVSDSVIEKIWNNWLEFAKYAFNKSHSVCYALVAYQTAYLKAHFPVEFMAALLTLENDPAKIPFFLETCKNLDIMVIGPNINLSQKEFTVQGDKILFGLRGIKNVGDSAISNILEERDRNGKFDNIFEFCERIDSVSVNKAVLESLIYAGALDELKGNRAEKCNSIQKAIEYANQRNLDAKRGQTNFLDLLIDEDSPDLDMTIPEMEKCEEWQMIDKLEYEKSVLGFYLSGHPLLRFKNIIDNLCQINTKNHNDHQYKDFYKLKLIGIVSDIAKRRDSKGKNYAIVLLEDLYGKFEVVLFHKDFENWFEKFQLNKEYFLVGRRSNYSNSSSQILRVIPDEIYELNDVINSMKGDLIVRLKENQIDTMFTDSLINLLKEYSGDFNVNLIVESEQFDLIKIRSDLKVFPDNTLLKKLNQKFKTNSCLKIDLD